MFKRNPERDHRAGYRDYNAILRSQRGPEKQNELLALRAIRRSRGALSPREAQQLLQYDRDAAHAYDRLAYRKPGEMPGVVADRAKWRALGEPQNPKETIMDRESKLEKSCRARFLKDVREAMNHFPLGTPQRANADHDYGLYVNAHYLSGKNSIAAAYCFPSRSGYGVERPSNYHDFSRPSHERLRGNYRITKANSSR